MKTALVHDWLLSPIGGSEAVLQELYSQFPSPIYTLFWNPIPFEKERMFKNATVTASFLQKFPWSKERFRFYLPFFPLAIEQFDLREYDLVLSSSHCVAKGVLSHPDQTHICYCHTPMRYAWDLSHEYLKDRGWFAKGLVHYLRGWDVHSAHRVDHFIANSHFVKRRIRRAYGKEASVIYPPVDTSFFQLNEKKENFYLVVSRLVSYKKVDLLVEAFSHLPDQQLVVVGDGPEMNKIRKKASPNVELVGTQTKEQIRERFQQAKALLFAAEEDFGITPVEAMACGTPVLAFRRGGATETVLDQQTGFFFEEQSISAILDVVRRFEQFEGWNYQHIRAHSLQFSAERFREEIRSTIQKIIKEKT